MHFSYTFYQVVFFPKVQNENELNPVSSQRIIFTKNEGKKTSTNANRLVHFYSALL